MKLIVGLGNPGPRYETTRHNAGFLALDRLIDRWNAVGPKAKGNAEIYEASFAGEKIILVKPQTFMNLSGKAVGPLAQFYQVDPEDMIVLYDELDLPALQMRVKRGGGTAGHNGIKSLNEHLGSDRLEYFKIRIGIGKPGPGNRIPIESWVLSNFLDEELGPLDLLLDQAAEAAELLVQGKATDAMNRYNQREKESE